MPIGHCSEQRHRNPLEWWQVSWHSRWRYRRYGSWYHFPMIENLMGLVAMGVHGNHCVSANPTLFSSVEHVSGVQRRQMFGPVIENISHVDVRLGV